MSGAAQARYPTPPARVLRLAILAWGLGDLAMGRPRQAAFWFALEATLLLVVVGSLLTWGSTTWYLLPYLLGMGFIVVWAWHAIDLHRRAVLAERAVLVSPRRSPPAAIAWLTIPLLLWGTGFWMVAGDLASPDAVLDRFVTGWAAVDVSDTAARGWAGSISDDPTAVLAEARAALAELRAQCAGQAATGNCGEGAHALLRGVRVAITAANDRTAAAVAQVVHYERRPSRLFGIVPGSELVAVPERTLIVLDLRAEPAAFGARRWRLVTIGPG